MTFNIEAAERRVQIEIEKIEAKGGRVTWAWLVNRNPAPYAAGPLEELWTVEQTEDGSAVLEVRYIEDATEMEVVPVPRRREVIAKTR